jgi:hypothetical protein
MTEGDVVIRRDYPVHLVVFDERAEGRWWGIPLLSPLVRIVLVFPHILWMMLIAVMGLTWMVLLGWIPILLLQRVPGFQAEISEELVHRGSRVAAYIAMLPCYPPFEIGEPGPVDVRFDLEGQKIGRWWGIPVVGLLARHIVVLPQVLLLLLLAIPMCLLWLLVWIPILLLGRIPSAYVRALGAYLRYWARVGSYALMLPVPYPPYPWE